MKTEDLLKTLRYPGGPICTEAADLIERQAAELERWKATVWAVARALNCLPSTFSDGNGHVLKAAIKHMADARRYQWLLAHYARGDGWADIDKALNDGEADTQLSPAIDAAMASQSPA